jgi:hypothetical protein
MVPDMRYRVETISGMPVVAALAAIDISTTDELRKILLDLTADGHPTVTRGYSVSPPAPLTP